VRRNEHVKGFDHSPSIFKQRTDFSKCPGSFVVEIEDHKREEKLLKRLLAL
jgi:hypothetical protein